MRDIVEVMIKIQHQAVPAASCTMPCRVYAVAVLTYLNPAALHLAVPQLVVAAAQEAPKAHVRPIHLSDHLIGPMEAYMCATTIEESVW